MRRFAAYFEGDGRHFSEGAVAIPAPHHHFFHQEYDGAEDDVMGYWDWKHFPLGPDDDPCPVVTLSSGSRTVVLRTLSKNTTFSACSNERSNVERLMPTAPSRWMVLVAAVAVAAGCAAGGRTGQVTGRVLEAAPSLESIAYATVVVSFTSRSPRAVRVHGYEIVWPRGRFKVAGSGLSLDPGEAKHQRVRVPASAGDLEDLVADPGEASVKDIDEQ